MDPAPISDPAAPNTNTTNSVSTTEFALSVGNNYVNNPQIRLSGCFADSAKLLGNLKPKQYVLLKDATSADLANAVANMLLRARVCYGQQKRAVFWFHYSGHGTQTAAQNPGSESDGKDEDIVMTDTLVRDDWLRANLVEPFCALAPYVSLVMVFDCCHSGTVCDLDQIADDMRRDPPNVVCMSACADSQLATETARTNGVFTDLVCKVLLAKGLDSNKDMLGVYMADINRQLKQYSQTASFVSNAKSDNIVYMAVNSLFQ